MTKEEWMEVEDELLNGIHYGVTLLADGYKVRLFVNRTGMKLHIMLIVKDMDVFSILAKKEEDLTDKEREVRDKFFCRREKNTLNIREIKKSKLSKKDKKYLMDRNRKFVYYQPIYSSFRTLKSTFTKNCKSIERVM